jgi:hypothetical protein
MVALAGLPGFLYGNGLRLAAVSLAWTVAALPLVTVGPATLAAYAAIRDLRSDRNAVDLGRVKAVLRENGAASALLAGVPVAFGSVAAVYGVSALERESLAGEAVALVAAYVALYAVLAAVPTFAALARGEGPVRAVRYGVGWLAAHPTPALATGLLTLVVSTVTVLLSVAFPLTFAGVAFSLQVAVVETVDRRTDDPTPAMAENAAGP